MAKSTAHGLTMPRRRWIWVLPAAAIAVIGAAATQERVRASLSDRFPVAAGKVRSWLAQTGGLAGRTEEEAVAVIRHSSSLLRPSWGTDRAEASVGAISPTAPAQASEPPVTAAVSLIAPTPIEQTGSTALTLHPQATPRPALASLEAMGGSGPAAEQSTALAYAAPGDDAPGTFTPRDGSTIPDALGPDRSAAPAVDDKNGEDLRADMLRRAQLGSMRRALDFYKDDEVLPGDIAAAEVSDPAGKLILEWLAIRFAPHEVGLARIEAFGRANPDWPAQNQLRRRAEEAFVSERKPAAAVRAFFASQPPQTPAGKFAMAEAMRDEGRTEEAVALVKQIWMDEDIGRAVEQRITSSFPGVLTTQDHRNRMERLLFKERWSEALRVAAMAGADYVKLAMARVAVGREAANAQKLVDGVPPALRNDTSFIYAKASMLRRKNKPVEAAQAIAKVPRDPAILVDGDEWWVERRILARKLLDINEPRLAYAVARDNGAESSSMKVEAEFHAGWIALRFLNDPVTARKHFDAAAAAATTPISVARAAYWQGRAAEAAGEKAEPFYSRAAENATTYYGQLARVKLGQSELPIRQPPEPPSGLDRQDIIRAISYLYELGERDLALSLFAEIGQRASATELTLYGDLALQKNDAKALLTLGKAALQRGLPLEVHAFPTIGVPKTTAPSADAVERAMVLAIARQESAFDPRARSGAGAQGLMQLMPATAKTTALRAGMAYDASRLTGDAVYNANIGATHLGDLVSEWRGSYILTFAGYNAGSGNVKKWIQSYGDPRAKDVDPVDWVERIPFTETRNYVQRVMENLQVYRGLLEQHSTLLIESDLKRGLRQ